MKGLNEVFISIEMKFIYTFDGSVPSICNIQQFKSIQN